MADRKLILVKGNKAGRRRQDQSQPLGVLPAITPAEAAEIARFKQLTMTRAARRAIVFQLMAELEAQNEVPPAA